MGRLALKMAVTLSSSLFSLITTKETRLTKVALLMMIMSKVLVFVITQTKGLPMNMATHVLILTKWFSIWVQKINFTVVVTMTIETLLQKKCAALVEEEALYNL